MNARESGATVDHISGGRYNERRAAVRRYECRNPFQGKQLHQPRARLTGTESVHVERVPSCEFSDLGAPRPRFLRRLLNANVYGVVPSSTHHNSPRHLPSSLRRTADDLVIGANDLCLVR